MKVTIAFFVLGYMLSQFYRACLAVLTPTLKAELGADAGDLALSLGLWYVSFALMQIPVGAALDRIGPRRTAGVLLALGGGGGAAAFALATGPIGIHIAMTLIGIGCSPVLMGAYFYFARSFSPALFGTLAAAIIAVGSLGNLLGTAPLGAAVESFGWRATLWALTGLTLIVAAGIYAFVTDPAPVERPEGAGKDSLLDMLRLPGLWLLLPLAMTNYTAAAGIRGLWAGPYLTEVHGADAGMIGNVTLAMGIAMIIGNFLYGPADRLLGSHRRVVLWGNVVLVLALAALWLVPDGSLLLTTALLAAVGLFGASFPVIMAHGRTFFPPHLIGRGVSLLNMFSIFGVAAMQFASRPVFESARASQSAAGAYALLFLFFLVPLVVGLGFYVFSRDSAEELR